MLVALGMGVTGREKEDASKGFGCIQIRNLSADPKGGVHFVMLCSPVCLWIWVLFFMVKKYFNLKKIYIYIFK